MAGSKTPGPLREWGDSPPWGGSGAPIGRSSARPDFLDRGGFDPETTALAGLRLPWNQPGKPFYGDAGELLEELLAQLEQVTELVDLQKLIQRLLGPQCFVLGVVFGVGENFVVSILDLLEMVKTLLLAELYDSTRRNPGWTVAQPGGIAKYLTAQMLNLYFGKELQESADERDALVADIKRVFEHPGDFFGAMQDQYVEKFKRLLAIGADPSPESQFQAGRVFGEVLLDVLAAIGAGAAVAKVASKMPRLLKLAGKLKGRITHRSTVGAGKAEATVSRGGPPASNPTVSSAAGRSPKPPRFAVSEDKYKYFFGKVDPPPEALKMADPKKFQQLKHNYDRSQQLNKVLGDIGIDDGPAGRQKLMGVFEKGMDQPEIARHVGDFGTTVTRAVDEGSTILEIKYFYEGGDLAGTPKVVTLIPKVKK